MVLLTMPVFFPVIVHLGLDPVWFGIIIVCVVEIGLISPPVGMNMFVLKSLLPHVLDRHRLPRGDALHVGRRDPARHPGGLPHHLPLASEPDALTVTATPSEPGRGTPGRALAWLAAAALLVIAWLSHLFATGLLLGALMGFTLQPVYDRLARWSRRPLLASVVTVLATGLVIVGAVVGFVSSFVTQAVALIGAAREGLKPGGALLGWLNAGDGLARPLRPLHREADRAPPERGRRDRLRVGRRGGHGGLGHLHDPARALLRAAHHARDPPPLAAHRHDARGRLRRCARSTPARCWRSSGGSGA